MKKPFAFFGKSKTEFYIDICPSWDIMPSVGWHGHTPIPSIKRGERGVFVCEETLRTQK